MGGATGAILRAGVVQGTSPHAAAAGRLAARFAAEGQVELVPLSSATSLETPPPESLDLVVAPFAAPGPVWGCTIPEGGSTSWLLVHAPAEGAAERVAGWTFAGPSDYT
jgi:hypothetical protein